MTEECDVCHKELPNDLLEETATGGLICVDCAEGMCEECLETEVDTEFNDVFVCYTCYEMLKDELNYHESEENCS